MTHTYQHRVRFRECDPMGIVYHVHYLDWFEVARTEALRELGVSYKSIEAAGTILPVTGLHAKYHLPARYDDEVLVETTCHLSQSGVRIRFEYEVKRKVDNALLVEGSVSLCFFDRGRSRPTPAPQRVIDVLRGESQSP